MHLNIATGNYNNAVPSPAIPAAALSRILPNSSFRAIFACAEFVLEELPLGTDPVFVAPLDNPVAELVGEAVDMLSSEDILLA